MDRGVSAGLRRAAESARAYCLARDVRRAAGAAEPYRDRTADERAKYLAACRAHVRACEVMLAWAVVELERARKR